MQIGKKARGRGWALALLAVATACGGKAENEASDPIYNVPAAPPPFGGAGRPPRRAPGPPSFAAPQAPLPSTAPTVQEPSPATSPELADSERAESVADAGGAPPGPPAVGVADAGAGAAPEAPPVVDAVDAGSDVSAEVPVAVPPESPVAVPPETPVAVPAESPVAVPTDGAETPVAGADDTGADAG